MRGHAARVIAVSSEESRRVSNAKTHNFPFLRAGRFREGFPGSAMSERAKRSRTGNNCTLLDKALTGYCSTAKDLSVGVVGDSLHNFEKGSFQLRKLVVPFVLIDLGHAPWVFLGGILRALRAASFVKMCGEGLIGRESNQI